MNYLMWTKKNNAFLFDEYRKDGTFIAMRSNIPTKYIDSFKTQEIEDAKMWKIINEI